MINKQSIYYWFFFPLLALLSAGSLTSCIYDSVLEETDMSGKSTLSITMRGITTTDPGSSGSYDDYVKTLRVIGYDNAGNVVCNQKWNGSELTVTGTESNTEITLTQQLVDAFTGGTCEFYFIANEDGYYVYTNGQAGVALSDFLGTSDNLKQAPSKDALDKCVIAFDAFKLNTNYPILMTATSSSQLIKPGENVIGTVYLVRCIAALQLVVKTPISDVFLSDVSLTGTCPDSFSLFNINYLSFTSTDILENIYLSPIAISEEEKNEGIVYSGRIFFPEQLRDISAKYSFSMRIDGSDKYFTPIVVDKGGLIERNNCYKTIATYDYEDSRVELSYEVTDWKSVDVHIPAFQ